MRETKVAVFKAILLTFESLLAGPTFARCAFKGALRGTKLDASQTDEGTYIQWNLSYLATMGPDHGQISETTGYVNRQN